MKEEKKQKAIKEITSEKEIKELLKSKEPVAIFFYAAWCGHCRVMKEPWENLNNKKKDVKFVKMESEDIPKDLGIRGFPRFVLIKNGAISKIVDGEMSEDKLDSKLFGGLRGGGRRTRARRLRRTVRKITH